MRLPGTCLTAALVLAACSSKKSPDQRAVDVALEQEAPEAVARANTALFRAGLEQAAPELEALQAKANREISQAMVEAWLSTIQKGDHDRAARELTAADVRVDTSCGNTPACAVSRIGEILRGNPRTLDYRPVTKGDRMWLNVAAGDFEDAAMASAEITVTLAYSSEGDLRFEELGVALTVR